MPDQLKNLTIKNKLFLSFAALLLILNLFGIIFLINTTKIRSHFGLVIEKDEPVIANANRLFRLVVDMETGQRGFCITNNDEFLEPYHRGIKEFHELLDVQKELVSDNPSQLMTLDKIDKLVDRWNQEAAIPEITSRREIAKESESLKEVIDLLNAGTGKKLIDEVRDEFNSFIKVEEETAKSRYEQASNMVANTKKTVITLMVFCSVFGAAIAVVTIQSITRPVGDLLDGTKIIGAGDLTHRIKVVHNDEIGDLTNSFNIMVQNRQQTEKELIKHRYHLEELVKDRTAKLENELFERKRIEDALRKSDEQVRTLLDSTAEAIYGLDLNGNCTFCNPACLDMLGYNSVEDLLGKNMHDLIHHTREDGTAYPMEECRIYEAFQVRKGSHVTDEVLWRADGTSFQAEYWSYPIRRNGDIIGSVVTFLDITDRKQAQQELKIAKDRAEAANIAKSQFLANVSHEIRTPMTVIIGFSKMLIAEGATVEQKIYAEHIQNAATSLLNIINDILDFSRIEAGKLQVEPKEFPLKTIIEGIDSIMRPLADKKDLEFKVTCSEELPAKIVTDEGRLRQCLINLVSNAIKFTDQGHVHLNVLKEERDGKTFIIFEVEDTGIGVPHDMEEHIFDSFAQIEMGSVRKYSGAGLGLTITNQLAELLGGEVSLTSEEGIGSKFSFSIPARLEDFEGQSSSVNSQTKDVITSETENHFYAGKVLVAEDDEGCRILEVKTFQRFGLTVVAANNGKEAVEKALSESFDLIFMDIRMPYMDGFEATQILHQKGVNAPIVALTAHAMEGYGDLCDEAGFDSYLTKPIELLNLLEILNKYLPTTVS